MKKKTKTTISDKRFKKVDYVQPATVAPKREKGAEFYSARYKYGYNWQIYQNLGKKIVEMMLITGAKDKKILDVGCGIGWFTDQLYFNVSRNIKGIDFSETAINFHCKRMYPAFPSEVADVYKYDYKGYDAFVLMETLEHLEKDKSVIEKFPKGSKVYGTVPFEKDRRDLSHVREYSMKGIRKRYGDLLDIQAVNHTGQFILFWGVRK